MLEGIDLDLLKASSYRFSADNPRNSTSLVKYPVRRMHSHNTGLSKKIDGI